MKLTDEQIQAVDLFNKSDSLKISAFAGTGKTSTLTAIGKSTGKAGLYLAFNRRIAEEARSKFPQTVACRTTHSLAYRATPYEFKGKSSKLTESMQGNKVAKILEMQDLAIGSVFLSARSLGYLTARTVQRFCQSADSSIEPKHVPLSGKLDRLDPAHRIEFTAYVAKLAANLWLDMSNPYKEATLGHDGYLKLWSLSNPKLGYDFILLDEAQDTNEAVLSVLRQQNCKLTLVGDRHQQIYEWRGAVNAMANVRTAAESALTRSFRFGETIAVAATHILSMLGESRALSGNPDRRSRILVNGQPNAILCRTNAGLITTVLDVLVKNQRPHVVGGVAEIMRLLEDVTRLKKGDPAESAELFGFTSWEEVVEFTTSEDGESLRSFVKIVTENGEIKLIDALQTVATDERAADIVISTGHKAKGREWDSVRLHSDFEPRVKKPDDPDRSLMNEEEARLLYVAATRARNDLIVPSHLATMWNVKGSPLVASIPNVTAPLTAPNPAPIVAPAFSRPPPLPSSARVISGVKQSPIAKQPTAPRSSSIFAAVFQSLLGKK